MPHQSIRHSILRSAIFASALSVAMTGAANAADLALTHAHIFTAPDAIPIEDGTILIHDSRIAAGQVIGLTILTVGDPFYPKGGTPRASLCLRTRLILPG
jgi:hypothetical protein